MGCRGGFLAEERIRTREGKAHDTFGGAGWSGEETPLHIRPAFTQLTILLWPSRITRLD